MTLFAIFGIALAIVAVVNGQGDPKIKDPELLNKEYSDIIVSLTSSVDPIISSIGSRTFPNRGAKLKAIADECKAATGLFQGPILDALLPFTLNILTLWLTNQILIKNATLQVIDTIRRLGSVRLIEEDRMFPREFINPYPGAAPNGTEWGVERIGAPDVWPRTRGEGVVVGVIDTGVRMSHEALADNFVGEKGWFDPYDGTQEPTDEDGHGTHCTGTICGTTGTGVAPGAQWMACRGCDTNGCMGSALLACGQFMLCPTDPDGSNEDCSYAPHIVSNSWGGGQGNDFYDGVINAWNAAGIIPFFAIMNNGPMCMTALSPGDRPGVISVGSTDINDRVSEFSSRGPKVIPDGMVAPLIVAPGEEINSASNSGDGEYQILSGTSMATPHTAGAAALLLSYDSSLTREDIERLIYPTANKMLPSAGGSCGNFTENMYPNDVAGNGRLNVLAAYNTLTGSGT